MAFSIKNPEADRLARELTAITGETITQAVVVSLKERLDRQQPANGKKRFGTALAELAEELTKYPVLDNRTPEEIIGYDENGLPT